MSQKNPNYADDFDKNPRSEKFAKSSPADAVTILNNFTTNFQKLLDTQYKQMQKLQLSSKASDKKLVSTLSSMMGTRANMMHADQNPVGKMSKQLSTARHKNVDNFLNASGKTGRDRKLLMRQMTKMAVETSNMLVEKFNNRAAAGASKKELRAIANEWMSAKDMFMKNGMVKDKYFNRVRMDYTENHANRTGKLSYIKFPQADRDYELQFLHYDLKNAANDASDALENFANELGEVGNWLSPLGKAFAGTPIGDIATVFGNAEKFGKQITEAFNGNDVAGVTKSRMGTLGKWFDEIGLSKLTGGEGGGAFERMFRIGTGGKIEDADRRRNAKGQYMPGLKGDDTLFGKMGSGLGKLASGKGFGGGKLGGVLGKAIGIAMKTPIGAILGVVGGIASAAIGIFKFLAKSSPVLQAVESMLNLFFTLFFMPFGNALGQLLLPLMKNMLNWVLAWNNLWTDFTWTKLVEAIGGVLTGLFGALGKIITGIPKVLIDLLLEVGQALFEIPLAMLKQLFVMFGWDDGVKAIEGWIQGIHEFVGGLKKGVQDIYDNICHFFDDPGKYISEGLKSIGDAAGNAIGDWWHNLTGLASGGIVQPTPSGTLALLAEGGEPEAVIPLSEFDNIFGSTQPIVINFYGDIYGMSDFESKVETVINRVSNRSAYR